LTNSRQIPYRRPGDKEAALVGDQDKTAQRLVDFIKRVENGTATLLEMAIVDAAMQAVEFVDYGVSSGRDETWTDVNFTEFTDTPAERFARVLVRVSVGDEVVLRVYDRPGLVLVDDSYVEAEPPGA
jgi:hypothetical protein